MKITQHPISNNQLEPFGDYHLSLLFCAYVNIHNFNNSSVTFTQLSQALCSSHVFLSCWSKSWCFFWENTAKFLWDHPFMSHALLAMPFRWGLPLFPSLTVTMLPWSGQLTWTWVKVIDSGSHVLQARPMRVFLEIFLRPLRRKCLLFSKISRHKDSINFKLPAVISGINQGKSVWKWSPQRRKRDQHTLFW